MTKPESALPGAGSDAVITMKVEPDKIATLAVMFGKQVAHLSAAIDAVNASAWPARPWFDDPATTAAVKIFDKVLFGEHDSVLSGTVRLRDECAKHFQALAAAARHYNRLEETNAALMKHGLAAIVENP